MGLTRKEARQIVAEYIQNHPELTYKQIAEKLNCGLSTVGNIASEFKIRRQHLALSEVDLSKLEG
jgi:DNA invertase Pin-like site-specific DNA recombinase